MSKHKIRLKEHERNRQRPAHPSKQAYARSDKSIDLTEYPLDTDEHGFIKTGVEVDDSLPSVFCVGGVVRRIVVRDAGPKVCGTGRS